MLDLHSQIKVDEYLDSALEATPMVSQQLKRQFINGMRKDPNVNWPKFNPKKHPQHRRKRNKLNVETVPLVDIKEIKQARKFLNERRKEESK